MSAPEAPADLRAALVDALDVVADGLIVFDAALRVRFFNRGAERIFGCPAAEMIGQPLARLLPPHLLEVHRDRIGAFAASHETTRPMGQPMELRIPRRDGSELPAEATITKLAHGGQRLFLVTVRDMTHHLAAERALQESEERYRSIVTAMKEGVVLQAADGGICTCNAAAQRILGLSFEEMCGRTSLDPRWRAVHEDGSPFPGEEHPAMITLRTGRPQSDVIMGVHRPDGSLVWISINSQPLFRPGEPLPYAVVTSFDDITERRRAEEALRESAEKYRSLYEQSIDGILLTAPDGRIFSANAAACAILGRSEAEICALGRGALLDSDDPRVASGIRQRDATGSFRGELNFLHPDGTPFPCDVSSSIFEDREGQSRAIVILRDATERIHAYQLLEQRVAERTRELTALLESARDIASTLDLEPLLTAVLTRMAAVIGYTGAGIAILEDEATLRVLDYVGAIPRERMLQVIPLGRDSPYREVVRRREPVIIDDAWGDSPLMRAVHQQWEPSALQGASEVRSWLGVPLIAKGRLIGVLRFDHAEPDHFTGEHARLALALADQVAVAIENARLYEQGQRLAVLEERQRLARELHDSVSQALYGMVLGAQTARALIEEDPGRAVEPLDYVLSLAEAAFAEMRALIFELRPDSLEQEGLAAALARQADLLRARHRLRVEAEICAEPDLPLAVKSALYRIAQEALSNVAKHARAGRVSLRLAHTPEATLLEIEDDGVGFDPTGDFPGHLGLRSMAERAAAVGGRLDVAARPGGGTRVQVRVPA